MGVCGWVAHISIVRTKKLRFFRILLCFIVFPPLGVSQFRSHLQKFLEMDGISITFSQKENY